MFTYVQHAQNKTVESRSGQGAEKYFDVALKTGDYYKKGIGTWGGRGGELSGGRRGGVGRLSHRFEGRAKRHLTFRIQREVLE